MADAAHLLSLADPTVMCSSTMTDSQKARRSNKPLMERRRRERINTCLNELKNLVLTAQRKDPSRYSKLEKADILEMTVRHVQALHRHEAATGRSLNTDSTAKYRAGFTQCAAEVSKFLAGVSGLPSDLHTRILAHLSSYNSHESQNTKSEAMTVKAFTPTVSSQQKEAHQTPAPGLPLIQARLTSGQLAVVLSSWSALPAGSSPPTTAASPESAGAPSSPESARSSPNATHDSHEGHTAPDASQEVETQTFSRLQPNLGHTEPPLGTPDAKTAPQVAPLDLATPHRRCGAPSQSTPRQRPASESKTDESSPSTRHDTVSKPPRPTVTIASLYRGQKDVATTSETPEPCQDLRSHRYAPYPSPHARPSTHHQQNPHWRPW